MVTSELMSLFILCQQVTIVGKYLFWFPRCFGNGIPLPFHVILIPSSSPSMSEDRLYLVYFFSINQFGWWFWKVCAVNLIFPVLPEQRGMKHIMDFPRCWEFQMVSHWSNDFCNFKWPLSLGRHLFMVTCLQVS